MIGRGRGNGISPPTGKGEITFPRRPIMDERGEASRMILRFILWICGEKVTVVWFLYQKSMVKSKFSGPRSRKQVERALASLRKQSVTKETKGKYKRQSASQTFAKFAELVSKERNAWHTPSKKRSNMASGAVRRRPRGART